MQITSGFVGGVYSSISSLVSHYATGLLATGISIFLAMLIFGILLAILITLFVYLFGWAERKIMARVHSRHGPTYVGKYGILQNLADVLKLLSKENIVPDTADRPLFVLVLPVIYALFVMMLVFIPITKAFVGIGATISLLAVFVLLSFSPLLLFLAGWTSGNKFASISAQRSVIMMVSYEVPMLLVVVAVAMLARTYSLSAIVAGQGQFWYALLMPIGFIIFFIVMLAEVERPPFDLREADNELIAGWLTDVSAPYYGLALFLDYTRMFVGSLLITLLFLGGWLGPSFLSPAVWILLKVVIVSVLIVMVRVSTTRMRIDRVLRTGWLYLVPLAVANLLLTFAVFVR